MCFQCDKTQLGIGIVIVNIGYKFIYKRIFSGLAVLFQQIAASLDEMAELRVKICFCESGIVICGNLYVHKL